MVIRYASSKLSKAAHVSFLYIVAKILSFLTLKIFCRLKNIIPKMLNDKIISPLTAVDFLAIFCDCVDPDISISIDIILSIVCDFNFTEFCPVYFSI